jgi:hypothetical protein
VKRRLSRIWGSCHGLPVICFVITACLHFSSDHTSDYTSPSSLNTTVRQSVKKAHYLIVVYASFTKQPILMSSLLKYTFRCSLLHHIHTGICSFFLLFAHNKKTNISPIIMYSRCITEIPRLKILHLYSLFFLRWHPIHYICFCVIYFTVFTPARQLYSLVCCCTYKFNRIINKLT